MRTGSLYRAKIVIFVEIGQDDRRVAGVAKHILLITVFAASLKVIDVILSTFETYTLPSIATS